MMKARGESTDINVPESPEQPNPAVAAIKEVATGEPSQPPGAEGKARDAAAVGSQGVGFALGLEEYMGAAGQARGAWGAGGAGEAGERQEAAI
jgi:hypothetical protein